VKEIAANILEAFKDTLTTEITWMSKYSRSRALKKVDNALVLVGYPDYALNGTAVDLRYKEV
jgi:predicted metalloendopeptidase